MLKKQQTIHELRKHLDEQIFFIESSAEAFDKGCEAEAKRLAVSIRTLLHDTTNSKSLLGQLGMKNLSFYSTADHESAIGIVGFSMDKNGAKYTALLDGISPEILRQVDFTTWWNEPVFIYAGEKKLSRRELILTVANQDGGAHVDPSLNGIYAELSRENALGWRFSHKGIDRPMGGPELAAVRQIAHEVLKTIKKDYKKLPVSKGTIFSGIKINVSEAKSQGPTNKIGRNEPCPCKSGLKYKRCCGK